MAAALTLKLVGYSVFGILLVDQRPQVVGDTVGSCLWSFVIDHRKNARADSIL